MNLVTTLKDCTEEKNILKEDRKVQYKPLAAQINRNNAAEHSGITRFHFQKLRERERDTLKMNIFC